MNNIFKTLKKIFSLGYSLGRSQTESIPAPKEPFEFSEKDLEEFYAKFNIRKKSRNKKNRKHRTDR